MPSVSRDLRFRVRAARSAWLLLGLLGAQAQSLAQVPEKATSPDAQVPIEVFQGPRNEHPVINGYPRGKNATDEGWVNLSFMVDSHGKASEIAVMESTGDKDFEAAALRAVQATTFTPATLNGKPIDSAYQMRYLFRAPWAPVGASREFFWGYKSLMAAIRAKDKPAADAAMKGIKIENLYEDAHFGLAIYDYARLWGDQAQQLGGLRRALAWQQSRHALETPTYIAALSAELRLELEMHEYREAGDTWVLMKKSGVDPSTLAKVAPVMGEVEKLRTDDREVAVDGQIRNGAWYLGLFKRHFRIAVSQGYVSDVRLRCDRQYVYFAFDPKLQYDVNGRYGSCSMQVEGSEGARFTVIEF